MERDSSGALQGEQKIARSKVMGRQPGFTTSQETRDKIRQKLKGKAKSPAARANMAVGQIGRRNTPEECAVKSAAQIRRFSDPAERAKVRHLGQIPVNKLLKGEAARNNVLRSYKKRAARCDLVWNLSDDFFFSLTRQSCFYCGIEPKQEYKSIPNGNGSYFYNGVDRRNNSEGYTIENCVPCCGVCNFMKRTLDEETFMAQVIRIVAKRSTKN